jgi:hypothetical protein
MIRKKDDEMNINELTGVKQYKDIPLHDLITKVMADNGFEKLGSGAFGVAYRHGNDPFVYKLFVKDSCYAGFVEYAKENPSIHYPKIYGFKSLTSFWKRPPAQVDERLYVAKVEYIEPFPYEYASSRGLSGFIRQFGSNGVYNRDIAIAHAKSTDYGGNGPEYVDRMIAFAIDCAKALRQLSSKCYPDLHIGNLGIRRIGNEDIFVVIDPALSPNDSGSENHPLDRKYINFYNPDKT